MNPAAVTALWHRTRAALLEAFPEIDAETLRDTLEGQTDALDLIASLILGSEEDAAEAEGLAAYIDRQTKRHARIVARSTKRRAAAFSLMQEIGERKLKRPEFSAFITAGSRSAVVTDRIVLPAKYLRFPEPEPKLKEIAAAIKAGEAVPGAHLSNGSEYLKVLT